MSPVRPGLCLLTLSLLVLLGACSSARVADDPLFVFNEHPAQRTVMSAAPRSASVLGSGQWRGRAALSWTSHWLRDQPGGDFIQQDGETVWADFELGHGIGAGLELEVRLSLGHASGGVLDSFIEGWHEVFGLPQSQRNELPRDAYELRAMRYDQAGDPHVVHELSSNELLVGDLPIGLVYELPLGLERFALSLRGAVEFPLGNQDHGASNGEIDYLIGAQAELALTEGLMLRGWGSYTWAGSPDVARKADFDYSDVLAFGTGISVRLLEQLVLIAQADWQQSVLRRLDEPRASHDQLLLWLGGRVALSQGVGLELSVAEDLVLQVSPDVQFHLGIVIK